jgi:hypothetical protein
MHRGRKVLEERYGTPIVVDMNPRAFHFEPLAIPQQMCRPALASLPEVRCVGRLDEAYEIVLREGTDPAQVMRSHIVQTVGAGAHGTLSTPARRCFYQSRFRRRSKRGFLLKASRAYYRKPG